MSSNGNTKIIKTEKRIVIRQKSPVKNNQTKFDQLYQNYITIRAKNELLRQRILQEREKKELSYCTFSPKLTKIRKIIFSKKHLDTEIKEKSKSKKIKREKLSKSNSKIENLINRQNQWLEKKNLKIKKRVISETMKNMEKCIFKPKIKKLNKSIVNNLKTETFKIIEKPNFYLDYINKTKEFRKNKSKSNSKFYEFPISQNGQSRYKSQFLKINLNDYDYTKHELSERSYMIKTNSNTTFNNNNISLSTSNKSLNKKERKIKKKSIPLSELKLTNLSAGELYKLIYINEKDKLNKEYKDYSEEYIEKIFGEKKQIHFKQAMEKLHYALIDLNLDDEKENNNNHINRNIDFDIDESKDNKINETDS